MIRVHACAACGVALLAFGCSSARLVKDRPAAAPEPPPAMLPAARVFLVGDGGVASFQEAQVEEQTEGAQKKVEKKHEPARALPSWARPAGGEKKVFKEIVDEVIGLAVKNARQVRLLQTLKGEAKNRDRLAPGAVPLVVWLGDNVYDHGVPRDPGAEGYKDGELTPVGLEYVQAAATLVVQAQVAVEANANAVFVPGNHDWDQAVTRGREGRERVIEEGEVLRRYAEERRAHGALPEGLQIRLLPGGGCPGPTTIDVPIGAAGRVRVAAVDTEWLLTEDPDKGCVTGGACKPCSPATREEVYKALQDVSRETKPQDALLVVAHHPLESYGLHGAQFFLSNPKSWMRWAALSQEDMPHKRNRRMREGLLSAFDTTRGQPLLYASGHDHNLQLIHMPSGPYVVVSGAASKTSTVRAGRDTIFAHQAQGYMVMDFFADGRVLLYVVEVPIGEAPVQRYPPFELRAAAARRQSAGVDPAQ